MMPISDKEIGANASTNEADTAILNELERIYSPIPIFLFNEFEFNDPMFNEAKEKEVRKLLENNFRDQFPGLRPK